VILQNFPGPGIFKKKSRTFQEAWEPPAPSYFISVYLILKFFCSITFQMTTVCNKVKGTMLQWSVGEVLISHTLAFEPVGG